MAPTITSVLNLQEAKRQLLIPESDTSQDGKIQTAINAGVDYVQGLVKDDIIDVDSGYQWWPVRADQPFRFHRRWVAASSDATYHLPTQKAAEAPGGTIRGGTMRLESQANGDNVLWPPGPDYEWPERADGTCINFVFRVGLTLNDPDFNTIKQASILAMRAFFDGDTDFRETNSIDAVLKQTAGSLVRSN